MSSSSSNDPENDLFLANLTPTEKRRFETVCNTSYSRIFNQINWKRPMDRNDWKIFVSLCVELGHLDESIDTHHQDTWKILQMLFIKLVVLDTQRSGKIHKLRLPKNYLRDDDDDNDTIRGLYDLPSRVGRLDQLRALHLEEDFRSLPLKELSRLPELRELSFLGTSTELRLSDDRLSHPSKTVFQFPKLEKLDLGGGGGSLASFQLLKCCHCPNLKSLRVRVQEPKELDHALQILSSKDFWGDSLEDVFFSTPGQIRMPMHTTRLYSMPSWHVTQEQLRTLFLEVVPKLPRLQLLQVHLNVNVASFQGIADHLQSLATHQRCRSFSKSLTRVFLEGNEDTNDAEFDKNPQTLQASLVTFLKAFPTILDLTLDCHKLEFSDDFNYALFLNTMGRRLVEGTGYNVPRETALPLSAWPVVLERGQKRVDRIWGLEESPLTRIQRKACGIYYLLREGPALIGRQIPAASTATVVPAGN